MLRVFVTLLEYVSEQFRYINPIFQVSIKDDILRGKFKF